MVLKAWRLPAEFWDQKSILWVTHLSWDGRLTSCLVNIYIIYGIYYIYNIPYYNRQLNVVKACGKGTIGCGDWRVPIEIRDQISLLCT